MAPPNFGGSFSFVFVNLNRCYGMHYISKSSRVLFSGSSAQGDFQSRTLGRKRHGKRPSPDRGLMGNRLSRAVHTLGILDIHIIS